MSKFASYLLCILLLPLFAGCSSDEEASINYLPRYSDSPLEVKKTVYLFGVHPLHNPTRLFQVYQPLVDYLNRHLEGVTIKLEASRNYPAYDEKLFAGYYHFALPNPYQTVTAAQLGYHIFGKMGDDENFRGIILIRRDSGIEKVSDLKGSAISYPAPTALAATMMPQWYLYTHGLDVMNEADNRYVGSQESSMMNVYLNHTAAGATWPPPWKAFSRERPEVAAALEVKWQTEPLPNNGLVARQDVPEELVKRFGELLFDLHNHEEGRQLLAPMELSQFEGATGDTYQPVREFLATFEAQLRPIREVAP